ncbi:hypothetical protein ACFT5B_04525 [Luteimicrobium sp. NPDC057192]|uniref:hypothetical protein n=1 Tax=Luteimicrobium sp. NPDC057192 TaxID=3346042 RepID=UPI003629185A
MTGRADVLVSVAGLHGVARRQHGVCSRRQLAVLGLTEGHITSHLVAQRWREVAHDVVVLHRGPLTREARCWAAVLGGGDVPAALACWTALELHGLQGWRREPIHVVVPRGDKPARFEWLVVHESRRHDADDVTWRDGLPAHGIERAAIDAAAWQRSWRTASGLMAAVVQQRLTTPDAVLGELERAGRIRHRRTMQLALLDVVGGSQSLEEIDFARLCRRAGLPEPSRQERRRDARGKVRFLDVEWRLRNGGRLVVEVDGVGHMEREQWYDDLLRDAELGSDARTVRIRIPAGAARHEPDRVLAIVRRHLAALETGVVRSSRRQTAVSF